MTKKKYLISLLILFMLNAQPISAACTQEEINGFKRIEDEYKVTYELNKETKEYILYFERTNPSLYDYIVGYDKTVHCEEVNGTLAKCSSFKSGTYIVQIVGQTEQCNNVFKEFTLTLPKYNSYSEDPLCKGIEEFVLCSPTYSKEISYESFVSRVETYKKNKQKTEVENKNDDIEEKNNEFLDNIINYIKENLIQIIIVTIFITLVVITVIVTAKSIRESRRLE